MRPTLLYGEYELTLDEKNRLLVPAEVRRSLDKDRDGEAFFITVGRNRRTWLYPEHGYESLVSQLESELSPGEDRLAFDQMNFSLVSRVEWDKQGRMLLPDKYRTRTGLNRDVTMIGVGNHLEIWNRDDWTARLAELEARRDEIAERQRQAAVASRGVTTANGQ